MNSDDAVRQALNRLSNNASSHRGSGRTAPSIPLPGSRRRRFTQNEDVVVEYVSRNLQPDLHEMHEPAPAVPAQHEELLQERQLREKAEQALHETRAALQVMQTRLAHLEMDLNEARAQRSRMEDEAAMARALPAPTDRPSQDRGAPTRTRQKPVVAIDDEAEPQPVKWWLKKDQV
ncbi:MAG: hypothetical protein ACRYFY_22790 [Janthinobacterium lividum]